MYTERVKQWLASHVNLSVFTKDFDSEIQKVCKEVWLVRVLWDVLFLQEVISARKGEKKKTTFALPPAGKECPHDDKTFSGFHCLDSIRVSFFKCLFKNYEHGFCRKFAVK